jgi:hypothetical protein
MDGLVAVLKIADPSLIYRFNFEFLDKTSSFDCLGCGLFVFGELEGINTQMGGWNQIQQSM